MTKTATITTDAKAYITRNGGYPEKLPVGTTVIIGTATMAIERSNGFVISGPIDGDIRCVRAHDLRCYSAKVVVEFEVTEDEYNAEWLAYS
ncbi:MAG: hypothetical protein ACYTBJ_18685 [Planctomycetota bacterium]|jgi:hypothetical protein